MSFDDDDRLSMVGNENLSALVELVEVDDDEQLVFVVDVDLMVDNWELKLCWLILEVLKLLGWFRAKSALDRHFRSFKIERHLVNVDSDDDFFKGDRNWLFNEPWAANEQIRKASSADRLSSSVDVST